MTRDRITQSMIDGHLTHLNQRLGRPTAPYNENCVGNVGNLHLSKGYGGYCLEVITGAGGSVGDVIDGRRRTLRESYDVLVAMNRALDLAAQVPA
jgi:hypothetical protein